MVPLFKSLVRPILEYGNVVWAPCLINKQKHTHKKLVLKMCKGALPNLVTGMNNLEYEQRLIIINNH